MNIQDRIHNFLQQRKEHFLYRELKADSSRIDFSSNDYLGFSRSAYLRQQVETSIKQHPYEKCGATGSRLLQGNSDQAESLEAFLAEFHHAEAALIFNSGFDANAGLLATVARPGDIIFYDEAVHASIHTGMRWSGASLVPFRHNDVDDLALRLQSNETGAVKWVVTESVFSMDGDKAPLQEIARLADTYDANLIVDEAHAIGLFGSSGSGYCNEQGIEEKCFARVYTFGKAIGSHGAVVTGSRQLREYLINFCKPFIYSTALENPTLLRVEHAYKLLQVNKNQFIKLNNLIQYFKKSIPVQQHPSLIGDGPIFGWLVPGNQACRLAAELLQLAGLDVRPILSPTVPKGTERLRIILHSFNTRLEVDQLIDNLKKINN